MNKRWKDEDIARAKRLMKTHTASQTGRMFNMTKNAILGVLYRQKVKEGYTPPPDSKYAIKKPNYPSHLFR